MKPTIRKSLAVSGVLLLLSFHCLSAQNDVLIKNDPEILASDIVNLQQIDQINFVEQPVLSIQAETLVNDTVNLDQAKEIVSRIPTQRTIRLDPQQIQVLIPEIVTLQEDGYVEVDYLSFIPILIKAYQEQQVLIESLQQRLDQIESK